jgi:hypothetical protein
MQSISLTLRHARFFLHHISFNSIVLFINSIDKMNLYMIRNIFHKYIIKLSMPQIQLLVYLLFTASDKINGHNVS